MTDKYYNEMSESYNELHGEEQINKARLILKEILKKKKRGILLDVGGGTGVATEIFTENFDCIIIDPSEKLLEQGSPNIEKILASAEEIPFAADRFDVVVSMTSLHHADLEKALDEIMRVAKSDALVVVSFLKKSQKLGEFKRLFYNRFENAREIEEAKDIIFLNF
tara:strand:- start:4749 stop:5246 length:498 start_codon:yes stop_codon:yes gene_type:complete